MRKLLTILVLLTLLVSTFPAFAQGPTDDPTFTQGESQKANNGVYIVQMVDSPVISYSGGVPGFQPTASDGQKVDRTNPNVQRYAGYLDSTHDSVLTRVGGQKLYDYRYTFNGFAAQLSPDQAEQLKQQPDVVSVTADEVFFASTVSTPTFMGLTQPGGLWDQLGGPGHAGEGIIVGVIDSGIWPESLSFADDGTFSAPGSQWHGICQTGEEWPEGLCNNKLIGARFYNAGQGGNAGIDTQRPWEFNSPRDYNSHGTHTSSTAAGNYGVPAIILGTNLGNISGMAPRAHIAMYKALWSTVDGSTASGTVSDLVAAIDDATADGVDVISYSITGNTTTFTDPVAIAFLNAAASGIFVSVAAANTGPTASTVNHNYPWVTTVAAGTHDRAYVSSVTLGNGVTYGGVSNGNGTSVLPLIQSSAAGLPGADPTSVTLCFAAIDNGGIAVLDPAKVAGKIVLCDRGTNARVNKSLAVQQAGGLGMILANTAPNSLNADLHYVPTVHVDEVAGAAIKGYIASAGAGATAQLAPGVITSAEAPFVASFSSRGPARAGGGDLLKPDIMAPGVDVLAATSPSIAGRDFDFFSGTSMATPHVAGFGALLKQLHPDWMPAMIKSALMTTASQVTNVGNPIPGGPFAIGAGQARPTSAADPGLVYPARVRDWIGFLCGQGLVRDPNCLPTPSDNGNYPSVAGNAFGPAFPIDASDLNLPSIAIGDITGAQTVRRTVMNVSGIKSTYNVQVSAPAGFDVKVVPSTITIAPNQSRDYTVTFTRTNAALNTYAFGSLTWSDGVHNVRSPLVVRPVALAAPAAVSGNGSPISYNVAFGYTGAFTASARGLIPAAITAGTVADDPTNSTCSLTSPNAVLVPVTIAAGTTYARFSLFDADVNPGSDIDLCVFLGTTRLGTSGSSTSAEEVNLLNPAAGNYTVVVQGWGVAGSSPFKLHTWLLGSADAGNMVVSAPASATQGATGTINLTFSGLAPATRYLGSVAYSGIAGLPNPTIVRVDTP